MHKLRRKIKQIIKAILYSEVIVSDNLLLNRFYGHALSKREQKSVDRGGAAIPWYTYSAIEFIEQFDFSGKSIFEWGSGNSSIYFSKKAFKVTSIEHNLEWYNIILPKIQSNQLLFHADLEQYPSIIGSFNEKFDVILIDGERRFDCAVACAPYLKENGIIILDNSDWFYLSAAYLRDKLDLFQVDFHGFGPINDYTTTTSVFFTKKFKFSLIKGKQPTSSIGSMFHDEAEIIKKEDKLYNTKNSEIFINQFSR